MMKFLPNNSENMRISYKTQVIVIILVELHNKTKRTHKLFSKNWIWYKYKGKILEQMTYMHMKTHTNLQRTSKNRMI